MTAFVKLGACYACGHQSTILADTVIPRRVIREFGDDVEALEADLLRRIEQDYDFSGNVCPVKGCRKRQKQLVGLSIAAYDFGN